jgi:hypothetical protein
MSMGLQRGLCSSSKVGVVALTALTIFVLTVRPVTRPSSTLYGRLGLTRMSLLSEPAADDATPRISPAAAEFFMLVPSLAAVLALVLRTRRAAFSSVPLRRLKLPPPRRSAGSPSSD